MPKALFDFIIINYLDGATKHKASRLIRYTIVHSYCWISFDVCYLG